MNMGAHWNDLDASAKRRIAGWGSSSVALRTAALWDVHHRAADKVRGRSGYRRPCVGRTG